MSRPASSQRSHAERSLSRPECPTWCVTAHLSIDDEESWIHVSEPLALTIDVTARLVTSIEPDTGLCDGPYLMVGDTEYALDRAAALAEALAGLVRNGREDTAPLPFPSQPSAAGPC